MSAFVVTDKHINTLVSYAARHDLRFYVHTETGKRALDPRQDKDAQAACEILFKENVRSVLARYPSDTPDMYPMTIQFDQLFVLRPGPKPVEIIKACHCLDYQSCETNDWDTTDAYRILQTIEGHAISELPGYDAAEWSIS